MRFGPVPLSEAEGAVLAHSVTLKDGRLRKGTVLDAAACARLAGAGAEEVIAARLDPGDIAEDAAAARLAEALDAGGLRRSRATTGRVNLIAAGPGVARIDAAAVARVNAVDPMITLATVPEWQRCTEGTMVATVKIISYAVPGAALERACAAGQGALSLCPPVLRDAVLIETVLGDGPVSEKGAEATRGRLDRLGVALTEVIRVPHRADAIAGALRGRTEALQLILTASATSDPHDVGPEAVRALGGEVERFGMPVDPGNLLFLGRLGDAPVIGLPGCARAPALNGADWVLERLVCGVPVGQDDIAAMGVGGLLKEIPSRPRPRDHGRTGR